MNMYICIHIWTCIFAYIHVYEPAGVYKRSLYHTLIKEGYIISRHCIMCVCIYIYEYIYTHEYMCIYIYTYVHEPDRLWKGGMYQITTKIWRRHIFNMNTCTHIHTCMYMSPIVCGKEASNTLQQNYDIDTYSTSHVYMYIYVYEPDHLWKWGLYHITTQPAQQPGFAAGGTSSAAPGVCVCLCVCV